MSYRDFCLGKEIRKGKCRVCREPEVCSRGKTWNVTCHPEGWPAPRVELWVQLPQAPTWPFACKSWALSLCRFVSLENGLQVQCH